MNNGFGIPSGMVDRSLLHDLVGEKLNAKASKPVPTGDNQGYELGLSLGYQDAMKEVLSLIGDAPYMTADEVKQRREALKKPWHHAK